MLLDQNIFTTRKNIFFTGGGDTNFFNVFILTTRKKLFNHKMLFFFHRNMKKWNEIFFFCNFNFCTEILVLNRIIFFFHVSNRGNKKIIHKCSAEYISCELWQIYSTRLTLLTGSTFQLYVPWNICFPCLLHDMSNI